MRIRICSDLHLESKIQPQDVIKEQLSGDYDVLILAGDIANVRTADAALELIRETVKVPIVWVLGNHEFWGTFGPMADNEQHFRKLAIKHGVHLLENDTVEILGKKIFGATLWFKEVGILPEYRKSWVDFQLIGNGHPSIPRQIFQRNENTTKIIAKMEKVDVIVTHHLPSYESVHPAFARSNSNMFFVSDMKNLTQKAGLWIHGHTHWGNDYINMYGVRTISNPYGYDDSLAKAENFCNYKPQLTIDI